MFKCQDRGEKKCGRDGWYSWGNQEKWIWVPLLSLNMRRPWAKQAPSLGKEGPSDLSCLPLQFLSHLPPCLPTPAHSVLFLLFVPILTPLLLPACLSPHHLPDSPQVPWPWSSWKTLLSSPCSPAPLCSFQRHYLCITCSPTELSAPARQQPWMVDFCAWPRVHFGGSTF